MSSFTKALGWGFGLTLAFMIVGVASCAVLMKASEGAMEDITKRIEAASEQT